MGQIGHRLNNRHSELLRRSTEFVLPRLPVDTSSLEVWRRPCDRDKSFKYPTQFWNQRYWKHNSSYNKIREQNSPAATSYASQDRPHRLNPHQVLRLRERGRRCSHGTTDARANLFVAMLYNDLISNCCIPHQRQAWHSLMHE